VTVKVDIAAEWLGSTVTDCSTDEGTRPCQKPTTESTAQSAAAAHQMQSKTYFITTEWRWPGMFFSLYDFFYKFANKINWILS